MTDNPIQNALEQDAQWIEERMPMNNEDKTILQVIERVKEFAADSGLSYKKISSKIGVSAATVSNFVNDKYKGDRLGLAKKLVSLMDSSKRKARKKTGEYVETKVARKIAALIKTAEGFSDDYEAKIGVVIGDAGHGKSMCLRQYAAANPNTVYVVLDDTMTSTHMFSAIARQLKLDHTGALKTLTQRMIDKLAGRSLVVILDEASSLDVRKLSQLRQVITVRCRCPLILSGNNQLLSTMNQTSSKYGHESLDQFRSRSMVLNLDEWAAENSGDGGLYSAEEIRKLYAESGLRLTGSAVAALKKISRTPQSGRLRTCGLIVAMISLSSRAAQDITSRHIAEAVEALGIGLKSLVPVAEILGAKETDEKKIAKTA